VTELEAQYIVIFRDISARLAKREERKDSSLLDYVFGA
jgi:hypothetical protein